MSKVLPRELVIRQLTERLAGAPTLTAAGIEARFNAALKAAHLPDKPAYKPEEIARIGEAMMKAALQELTTGVKELERLKNELEPPQEPKSK